MVSNITTAIKVTIVRMVAVSANVTIMFMVTILTLPTNVPWSTMFSECATRAAFNKYYVC